MGRAMLALTLLAAAACQREPSFDERFANASATIADQSAAMDNQMRGLEARERADEAALGNTAPPADTTRADPTPGDTAP